MRKLNVVLVKPTQYREGDWALHFRRSFMPNSTLPYIRSLTPDSIGNTALAVYTIDECAQPNMNYLRLLNACNFDDPLLVAFVGVQSQQMHRALDLAAYAKGTGAMVILGGPHAMTCEPTGWVGKGISIAQSEADLVWLKALQDACDGQLKDLYAGPRWKAKLDPPVLKMPSAKELRRYLFSMIGLYPFRGCPFRCNYCSIIKTAGNKVRSQPVATTIASLKAAEAAGIKFVMFTSDNFNKYQDAFELLEAMIEERINLSWFCQCDMQLVRQPELVELMAKAGCFEVFLGMESFDRDTLRAAHKFQNKPETYAEVNRLLLAAGIKCHFSNMIAFPGQTESGVLEHYRILKEINPANISIYILTPVPGTEQYGDFLQEGRITERNLDWFDSTNLVWEQGPITRPRARELMFRGYREFFSAEHAASVLRSSIGTRVGNLGGMARSAIYSGFVRYMAYQQIHPMSGGVGLRKLDRAANWTGERRKFYWFDYMPLPKNLDLSAEDAELNAHANPNSPILIPISRRKAPLL